MYTDPLLAYEKKQKQKNIFRSLGRTLKFLVSYLFVTGWVFAVLLALINYSAYSARLMNYINPEALISAREQVETLLSSTSIEVHASEEGTLEKIDSLETVTEKIIASSPEIVYKKLYSPAELLAGLSDRRSRETTFSLTPYENRIIIPRIGKNIPLVDIASDLHPEYEVMHETFMEELKKWVVRYPGTARPGEVGNVFIFGHSSNYPWVQSEYNDIFALLDELQTGDEITIYYFQKKYVYTVTDRAIVKPGDVQALDQRDPEKKELSLMTCWPIGTTLERLIIFAELTEAP
jgi:LPXTG-site transpeptidase (sortase) family protein